MAIPTDERKSKTELIQELESLRAQLASNTAAQQLAIIQEIETTLANEHDLDAIYTAVGNKLVEIFDAQVIGFYEADLINQKMHFPWSNERGVEDRPDPVRLNSLYRHTIEQGGTLLINEGFEELAASFEDYRIPHGLAPKSVVAVPVVTNEERWLSISLQDMEKEHAFSPEDIRLLELLAATMGTALENARLFEETNRRNAELAIINSVQQRLAAKLDIQSIVEMVGEKVREIFQADTTIIATYEYDTENAHYRYVAEKGDRFDGIRVPFNGFHRELIRTRKTILFNENLAEQVKPLGFEESFTPNELPKSALNVPLIAGGELIGHVALEDMENEHAFSQSDVSLLETLANSMSIALENARLFDETNQRNAELAIINTVQEGLAAELDMRGIYQLVGDKIGEITGANVVLIASWDRDAEILHIDYGRNYGEYFDVFDRPFSQLHREVFPELEKGKTIVWNEKVHEIYERTGHVIAAGEIPKTLVGVPFRIGGKIKAFVSIQDFEQEFAFDRETIRLVETLTANMEIALENARLFEETQARNAELAVINSVQQGLASKLEMQAIYDLVGDKVSEITGSEIVVINTWDKQTGKIRYEYIREKGERIGFIERDLSPLNWHLLPDLEAGKTFIRNENVAEFLETFGHSLPAGEMPKTVISIPLKTGDKINTSISLQDTQREHAFDESTIRLVETLARSMGIALENARLFDEVQRNNKEIAEALDRETASNDILRVIAESPADIQPVLDAIAESAAHLSDSEDVVISLADNETLWVNAHFGEIPMIPVGEGTPLNEDTVAGRAILQGRSLQAVHHQEGEETEFPQGDRVAEQYGYRMTCAVPMIRENKAIGTIAIRRTRPELLNEQHIRLIESFANQAAIAVENVRLFNETQRLLKETEERNAELAVINSVQEGLAAELDFQGIVDLVGDTLREVLDTGNIGIRIFDPENNILHFPYEIEHGERLKIDSMQPAGLSKQILATSKPYFGPTIKLKEEFHMTTIPGTDESKALLAVPIMIGDAPRGLIVVEDFTDEHAYSETDVRLMETLANSMSVALENARLFGELQNSNREISAALERQTATGDILRIMANSPGEIQPVLAAVAEHAAKLVEADDVQIYQADDVKLVQMAHYGPLPALKDGESLPLDAGLATGRAVLERRTIQLDAGNLSEDEYPISVQLQKRLKHRTVVMTPLVREGNAVGAIVARRNEVREYSDIQVDLLRTFANQAAIAIENVRLFEETKRLLSESMQQAEELKTVNTVSTALSSELELDALIELIGSQVQKIFSADVAYVGLLDQATKMIKFPFSYGEETRPLKLGEGLTSRVILEGQPLLINQDEEWSKTQGRIGVKSKSYLGVPISVGKDVIGVISVQSTQWTNMYGQKEVRLLSTIAANVGAAIANANLFQEVERQKVYFEALISSAPVAIVTIDLDGNISGWSPAAEELYGYTPEEAIGKNIDDLVANHPSIREEAENYTNVNIEQPGPNQIQLKTQRTHKDGRLIDVTVSAMPVYIEGERRGYIAIYNDISQLEKARRDAEEANQAKSAFLANMSHELRTPLNAIIGFTRIVKRKGEEILPEKQIDNLDKVLVSAEHLLGLINTVLDISKIEAGRMDIHVSSFDLKPLIDLVMVTTQPLVRQDQVDLVSDVADGLPIVQSDLEKIKQILINLLSNAAKFTHQGEIKVAVREAGGQISIGVSDTGIGISPEAVERVFEEFQQADVSTTREYGGTGLGLSISRSLARLLGGDLTVTSEQGKGSVFTLTLPVNFAQQEETPVQEDLPPQNVDGHLVLVIDDNEDAIYLMRENLESAGYRVAVARNGEEGLAMAKELNPFAITLDIMMPKKDGWQVLHDLKQNPETRSIPVIMISIVDKKALGYRLGAADYLVKPLNEDQVLVSLDKLKEENGDKPLKRLLVVDDDPNIADMVRQLLEDSHYQIEEARDGQEAWEQVQVNPPDAILLDLMMPRLDGFGLIEKLKQSGMFADLPVIVLTAKLLNEGERNALNDSVGKVIQKQGLSGEALLDEISNSIRTSI